MPRTGARARDAGGKADHGGGCVSSQAPAATDAAVVWLTPVRLVWPGSDASHRMQLVHGLKLEVPGVARPPSASEISRPRFARDRWRCAQLTMRLCSVCLSSRLRPRAAAFGWPPAHVSARAHSPVHARRRARDHEHRRALNVVSL